MTVDALHFAILLAGSALLDARVRPRAATPFALPGLALPGRAVAGLWLTALIVVALFGLFLAVSGNAVVAVALALAVQALLVLVSNAKHAMLGEPLLFSDLALIGAVFRHPQFYLSAIRVWQRVVAGLAALALLALLSYFFVPSLPAHLAGLAILAAGLAALASSLRLPALARLARRPDAPADVLRLGLLPVLVLYWLRWRASADPAPCPPPGPAMLADAPEVLVVVQCESFADPAELFGDPALALPALEAARREAWQWGDLAVSGFGAYTMRTEYGVLFGRDEESLGFRRYDPFLTAAGETSYALPARLAGAGLRGHFVHPHDLRFYNRDRIMPACGFADLVGEDRFEPVAQDEGRYVTDAAVAERIAAIAEDRSQRSLVYAVTIENHGPWAPEGAPGRGDLVPSYLRLVRNSDAMLARLRRDLAALRRPSLLVFFGDHRPSIPGASMPGAARHTPYVMIRLDGEGQLVRGANSRVDLTPAQLHHAILGTVLPAA